MNKSSDLVKTIAVIINEDTKTSQQRANEKVFDDLYDNVERVLELKKLFRQYAEAVEFEDAYEFLAKGVRRMESFMKKKGLI